MSIDTPITDKEQDNCRACGLSFVLVHVAEDLEHRLAEAQAEIVELKALGTVIERARDAAESALREARRMNRLLEAAAPPITRDQIILEMEQFVREQFQRAKLAETQAALSAERATVPEAITNIAHSWMKNKWAMTSNLNDVMRFILKLGGKE